VCSVSFILCVVLYAVFCLSVVCYFVLCLIVVPLPSGKNIFDFKINDNKNQEIELESKIPLRQFSLVELYSQIYHKISKLDMESISASLYALI
jgi:hypothetical protein